MRILTSAILLGLLCLTPPQARAAGYLSGGSHGYESAVAPSTARAATAQYYPSVQRNNRKSGDQGRVIPPSMALQVALEYSPGSQGLGVSLLRGPRLMYAVKLKTGNQIHRVLVDAQTAQVVGE